MNIQKSGDSVKFRFLLNGEEIRRIVPIQELVEFLVGESRQESNLPDDRLPIKTSTFFSEKYLPRCAKPNLKANSYDREVDSANALLHYFTKLTWNLGRCTRPDALMGPLVFPGENALIPQ